MKMFKDAINGFLHAAKTEWKIGTYMVIASCVLLHLLARRAEVYYYVLAYMAIATVISSELMNTALERLCDFVEPEHNEEIKHIKDISASAVLLNVVFSILIGYVIWIST